MSLEKFIEDFQNQLEDTSTTITPETDYKNQEYWDSLTAMVVKVLIEDEYGVDIQPEELNNFNNIKGLYNFVLSKKK